MVNEKEIDEFIEIKQYDPQWNSFFEQEKEQLLEVFRNENIQIEHFGSTSIEGMIAKPIIDILIGLESLSVNEKINKKLEELGYENFGEISPGRIYLRKRSNKINFNLAITIYNGVVWESNLIIRDFLRKNSLYRDKYSDLKKQSINSGHNTLIAYSDFKSSFMILLFKAANQEN